MDKLIAFLNRMSVTEQIAFATRCETSVGYLRKACSKRPRSKMGAELCVRIEQESAGEVSRRDLRDTDWWCVWPELVNADFPIPQQKAA